MFGVQVQGLLNRKMVMIERRTLCFVQNDLPTSLINQIASIFRKLSLYAAVNSNAAIILDFNFTHIFAGDLHNKIDSQQVAFLLYAANAN